MHQQKRKRVYSLFQVCLSSSLPSRRLCCSESLERRVLVPQPVYLRVRTATVFPPLTSGSGIPRDCSRIRNPPTTHVCTSVFIAIADPDGTVPPISTSPPREISAPPTPPPGPPNRRCGPCTRPCATEAPRPGKSRLCCTVEWEDGGRVRVAGGQSCRVSSESQTWVRRGCGKPCACTHLFHSTRWRRARDHRTSSKRTLSTAPTIPTRITNTSAPRLTAARRDRESEPHMGTTRGARSD